MSLKIKLITYYVILPLGTDCEIVLNCVGNYNISYLIEKIYVSVFNHMNDLCHN
jgi:hypothetical protein